MEQIQDLQRKTATDTGTAGATWLLWAGFILVALNLRIIFASVGPVLKMLDIDLSTSLLVTTLPPLLLGVFCIAGLRLRHWLGEERAMLAALVCLVLGCALRGLGASGLLYGTVIGSLGVATLSVIMPALVRKRFAPQQIGPVMGLYALMLGLGAVLAAGASFPLYTALGESPTAAFRTLGLWSIPALLALLLWLPQASVQHHGHDAPTVGRTNVYRSRLAWSITLFFGLQALNLYAFLAWLPAIYMDRGASAQEAAWLLAASQISLTLGGLLTPIMAARAPHQRNHIRMTVGLCLVGTLGVMWAPVSSAIVWVLLLGFGQGAGPSLGAFLFVARSANRHVAVELSAMAQTLGYLIAALGPLLMGGLHRIFDNWSVPLGCMVGILIVQWWVSMPAGNPEKVGVVE